MNVEGEDSGTPTSRSQGLKKLQGSDFFRKRKSTGGCDISGGRKRGREERGREGVSIIHNSHLA